MAPFEMEPTFNILLIAIDRSFFDTSTSHFYTSLVFPIILERRLEFLRNGARFNHGTVEFIWVFVSFFFCSFALNFLLNNDEGHFSYCKGTKRESCKDAKVKLSKKDNSQQPNRTMK